MTTTQPPPGDEAGDGQPVHFDDAERIVLGALMVQPDLVEEVAKVVTPGDFYRPHHTAIFSAITANAALGEPVDPVGVALTLARNGDLKRLNGGANYLHTCMRSVPVVASAAWYAQKVAEAAYARRAEVAAIRLHDRARTGNREAIADAIDSINRDILVTPGDNAAWRSQLVNGATFIYEVPDKTPAVWGDGENVLWAEGEALMICGPQGVGKTTVGGQVVFGRLGLLSTVLGWSVVPGRRRVLYLAMDRPQQAARALQRLARPEWRDIVHDRLIVWQGPPPADFALSSTVLLEMCRAADADTVVIDSVKDAAVGIAKDEVGAGYNRCRQTAIAAGIEVLELHHQRKTGDGGGKPNTLSDVYGSTWITSGAGSVLLLWGAAGDPVVELLHLKSPRLDVGPLTVIHDHERGMSQVDRGDITKDLFYLARHTPRGLTAKVAAVALFSKPDPDRNEVEKARRKLEGHVRAGHMHRVDGVSGGSDGGTPATYFLVERRGEGL